MEDFGGWCGWRVFIADAIFACDMDGLLFLGGDVVSRQVSKLAM